MEHAEKTADLQENLVDSAINLHVHMSLERKALKRWSSNGSTTEAKGHRLAARTTPVVLKCER